MAMMKAKRKTKNNLCGRDCDPAFSFIFKNKKRDISAKYISCNFVSSTNLLANVIITSIILYVKQFLKIHFKLNFFLYLVKVNYNKEIMR